MRTRLILLRAAMAILLCAMAGQVHAQRFPTKSIRLIVPYDAGGPTDVIARGAAQRIAEGLGGAVLVENRPGAGTILGAELVAKSAPDGYTLFLTTGTAVSINQHMFKKLPYNPEKDFVPIGMLGASPYGLFAHPSVPGNSLKEMLVYAKANPGKLNVGLGGAGTPPHFAMQMLEMASGASFTGVMYKGTAPALGDLLDARIQMILTSPVSMLPHVRAGKLKAYAITSATRFQQMPDVPAVSELYPGFEAQSWNAIVAPAGTPREIIDRINAEIQKFTNDPVTREKMLGMGMVLEGGTPEQLAAYIKLETARWGALIKKLGLTLQ